VIGNVPGNVGTKHESTERKQNLYGETYPTATLEALGLTGSKTAAEGTKAAKKNTKAAKKSSKGAKK
jgi:hypothetical protein